MKVDDYLRRRIVPVSPRQARTADAILTALGNCSFQGRALSRSLDVLENMVRDEQCMVVLTLAGAMVPAGMEETIVQLIEEGVVDVVVTTGANVSHSMVNHADERNQGHFVGSHNVDDADLFRHSINRIYDTFLPESGYHKGEQLLEHILEEYFDREVIDPEQGWTVQPSRLFRIAGNALLRSNRRGMLASAAEYDVPIYCGATSDSEFGLNLVKFADSRNWRITLNELDDVRDYSKRLLSRDRSGTFIVGGGVPRNWAQQAWPYLEMTEQTERHGFDMTVRIYTDSPAWGGLSGCTVSESISWGKYSKHAVSAEVQCDATIALPLLSAALFERLERSQ